MGAGALRLRGGASEFTAGESEFRKISSPLPPAGRWMAPAGGGRRTGLVDQPEEPDARMPKGAITADDAERLRQAGVLHGRWAAESEEEPSSDLKDAEACYRKWPDTMGGEEENDDVVEKTHGPVRIFGATKYDKDVLPVGQVKPSTLRRLKKQLDDVEGYAPVHIVEEDSDEGGEVFGPRRALREVAPPPKSLTANSAGGGKDVIGLGGASGVKLPPGVSPGLAQEWLDQVAQHNKFDGNKAVGSGALPELDVKTTMSPRRRVAEQALDAAIADNDEGAVESAINVLKQIDAEEEKEQRSQQRPW